MQVDLNRLKVFYLVFKLDGVSKAAERLNISQPGVSQHLKKLEAELGVRLFTRLHKKLVPTAAGMNLFEIVEPFLSSLPEKLTTLRLPADKPFGLLTLGSPYEFGQKYLPEVCSSYRQLYPDVQFAVRLGEPIPTLEMLATGEIDFAIIDLVLATGYLGTRADFYSIDSLIDEELILVCSKEYYEQKVKGDHSFKHLQTLEFISDEQDDLFIQHWFAHHFAEKGLKLNVVMKMESHPASLDCIKLGMGLTVTSLHFIWDEIENGEIVAINTRVKNAVNTISLIQLQDKKPTITEKSFHSFLKKYMQGDGMLHKFRSHARKS